MNLLGGFMIALSMYSKIPMPRLSWTDKRMNYALCFFPFVGVVILFACYLAFLLVSHFSFTPLFTGVLGTVLPLWITGGIHMDGFLDVTDARASFGTREKKLEILKDPHIGAFAIMGGGIYLLLYVAAISELPVSMLPVFGWVFIMSRSLSGLTVICLKKAKSTGLVAEFSGKSHKKVTFLFLVFWFLLSAWGLWCFQPKLLLLLILTGGMSVIYSIRVSLKEFGGVTGDLAGWLLQNFELVCLLTMVFWCKLG